MKKPKRPTDVFERAKLIGDLATGVISEEVANLTPTQSQLNSRKGGLSRANKLSAKRKKEIAKIAAEKRWSSKEEKN